MPSRVQDTSLRLTVLYLTFAHRRVAKRCCLAHPLTCCFCCYKANVALLHFSFPPGECPPPCLHRHRTCVLLQSRHGQATWVQQALAGQQCGGTERCDRGTAVAAALLEQPERLVKVTCRRHTAVAVVTSANLPGGNSNRVLLADPAPWASTLPHCSFRGPLPRPPFHAVPCNALRTKQQPTYSHHPSPGPGMAGGACTAPAPRSAAAPAPGAAAPSRQLPAGRCSAGPARPRSQRRWRTSPCGMRARRTWRASPRAAAGPPPAHAHVHATMDQGKVKGRMRALCTH